MLVKGSGINTLQSIEVKGDMIKCRHVQNALPAMRAAYDDREYHNTRGKEMWLVGRIPILEFFARPDLLQEEKAIEKFLNSDAGIRFKTIKGRV